MGKTIFLFPGQGSQFIGMGDALIKNFPLARETFEAASDILDYDMKKLCLEGPEEKLKLTENTQAAILTLSIAVYRVFTKENGVEADFVTGHSLGEYSALVAANCLDFQEAVSTVRYRGRFMQEAIAPGLGSMAVLLGGEKQKIKKLCEETAQETKKVCEIANYNSSAQVVISGHKEAVEQTLKKIKEDKSVGVRNSVLLPVSAPFHCSLLHPAADKLKPYLDKMKVNELSKAYIANVDAKLYRDSNKVRENLYTQIASPVLWEQSMQSLASLEVQKAYELGPGSVLKGLLKRIDRNISCEAIEHNIQDVLK